MEEKGLNVYEMSVYCDTSLCNLRAYLAEKSDPDGVLLNAQCSGFLLKLARGIEDARRHGKAGVRVRDPQTKSHYH